MSAAQAAFPHWSGLKGAERAVYLEAIANAIRKRKPQL